MKFAKAYSQIVRELRDCSDEEKKNVLPRFFKTGKGEYGEGDRFLGVTVPLTRKVAKNHKNTSYEVLEALLESEWHECRLCALLILIEKYKKEPDVVVRFYLEHLKGINNWDLVDLSAPYILGDYLVATGTREILYDLAKSSVMWEQRIAVVSTLMLIRNGLFDDTLKLAEMFLDTKHDLMQKATGWMLREIGKRNQEILVEFLEKHRHVIFLFGIPLRMNRTDRFSLFLHLCICCVFSELYQLYTVHQKKCCGQKYGRDPDCRQSHRDRHNSAQTCS